jgi:hypothetical protein
MASQMDVNINSVDYGAYIGANHRPLFKVPSNGGGITILDVHATGMAAGTSIGLLVVTASDAGTPAINGTVGAFAGTIVYAEGVVFEATVSSAYVAAGSWVCVDQTSGTAPANTILSVSYVMGK